MVEDGKPIYTILKVVEINYKTYRDSVNVYYKYLEQKGISLPHRRMAQTRPMLNQIWEDVQQWKEEIYQEERAKAKKRVEKEFGINSDN